MSVKKSKLDLLVRVRYQNPLPAPPFPPKLLNIPTTPARYVQQGSEFTAALANETSLPMVVDADLGMPLDLSFWECLWEEGDDSELNPSATNLPPVDSKDAFMLGDGASTSGSTVNGFSSSQNATPQVSWLRRTEYISKEGVSKAPVTSSQDILRALSDKVIDVSRAAQIRDIEASFAYSEEPFDLLKLKHPNKPGVEAVESFEVLPDADIWANAYDLFKFSERPGERHPDQQDPRLDCAILRPMESDGDHFLAYYLPKEDDAADSFKSRRREGEPVEDALFSFVRDYETVKIEQEVPNEFLLVIDNGDNAEDPFGEDTGEKRRGKGAYYKNIERKIMLKKKRVNQWDNISYTDKWDAINLTLAPFGPDEAEEREEALAEVTDPMYMLNRIDVDADGEVDDTEGHMHEQTEEQHVQVHDTMSEQMAEVFGTGDGDDDDLDDGGVKTGEYVNGLER